MRERLDWILLSRSYCSIIIHLCTITIIFYHTSLLTIGTTLGCWGFVWNFHSKNRRGIDGHAEIDVTASRAPICRLKKWWNVIAQTKACLVNIWWIPIHLYSYSKNHYLSTYMKIKSKYIWHYYYVISWHFFISRN